MINAPDFSQPPLAFELFLIPFAIGLKEQPECQQRASAVEIGPPARTAGSLVFWRVYSVIETYRRSECFVMRGPGVNTRFRNANRRWRSEHLARILFPDLLRVSLGSTDAVRTDFALAARLEGKEEVEGRIARPERGHDSSIRLVNRRRPGRRFPTARSVERGCVGGRKVATLFYGFGSNFSATPFMQ